VFSIEGTKLMQSHFLSMETFTFCAKFPFYSSHVCYCGFQILWLFKSFGFSNPLALYISKMQDFDYLLLGESSIRTKIVLTQQYGATLKSLGKYGLQVQQYKLQELENSI